MAEEKKVKSLKDQVLDLLTGENVEHADAYASYCQRQLLELDKKTKLPKNPWMKTKTAEQLAQLFRRVRSEGLVFDGKHITLQSTGISYDYIAYKNKMLLAYPESKIDMDIIKEGDTFTVGKENGQVIYKHEIKDPLTTGDIKSIVGAYCVIKNQRGEFITLLSKDDIAKHKRVAKTSMIWDAWFKEMVLKTVLKKGCKYHFDDIFEGMNEVDNESIDLSRSVVREEIDPVKLHDVITKIEGFKNLQELQNYYMGLAPEFIKNDDVFEAYNAQKAICKAPTKS